MKNYTRLLFILIILLASVLRFYKLGEVPPSLSWDETAVGYNAWTIANYGKDEYGNLFPHILGHLEDGIQLKAQLVKGYYMC